MSKGACHGAFAPLFHPAARVPAYRRQAVGLSGKGNIVKRTH